MKYTDLATTQKHNLVKTMVDATKRNTCDETGNIIHLELLLQRAFDELGYGEATAYGFHWQLMEEILRTIVFEDWDIVPKGHTGDRQKVVEHFRKGGKIKRKDWAKKYYIQLCTSDSMIFNHASTTGFVQSDLMTCDDWEIVLDEHEEILARFEESIRGPEKINIADHRTLIENIIKFTIEEAK